MASEIKVDTIVNAGGDNDTGIDLATNDQILLKVANATKLTMNSTGQTTIVGEGGTTTTSLQQGLCKVWINMDGTGTIAIKDSFNVSGITDNSTGQYRVAYTNNMSDSEYALTQGADGTYNGTVCSIGFGDSQNSGLASTHYDNDSRGGHDSGSNIDTVITTGSAHGDLA